MTPTYVVWTREIVRGAVMIDSRIEFEASYRLPNGVPLADGFPSDVRLKMDPDSPTNLLFVDVLPNPLRLLVVSERLADFVTARQPPEIEILPVGIVDHRGRLVKPVYRILHPIRPVDCLDEVASNPRRLAVNPEHIARVDRLVLDPARIDPARQIFRVRGFSAAVLVRSDLAQAIEQAGFTGVTFTPLDLWPD
jgi:hypothetical protein